MEDWGAYIPQDRRRALAGGERLPETTIGTALFADVSGFTHLSEEYSIEFGSTRGAEEVTLQMNAFFDRLVTILNRYTGSVISFSGDAVTCWFDGADSSGAVACAHDIQTAFLTYPPLNIAGDIELTLGVKVALARGRARRFLVGAPDIQVMDVMAGEVFRRVARIEKTLLRGEIGIDAEHAAAVGGLPSVNAERATDRGEPVLVLEPLPENGIPAAREPPDAGVDPVLPAVSEGIARQWILDAVFERLRSSGSAYVADLRQAVIFFISFETDELARDEADIGEIQDFILRVQTILTRLEGSLLQVVVGDKGGYLYGAFGAPRAHENDAVIALRALLEIRSADVSPLTRNLRIGVSQGLIYAGHYGGTTRKTYGVLGNEVNLAARIMESASPGDIIVSAAIYRTTNPYFQFGAVGSREFKGIKEKILLYRLLSTRAQPEMTKGRSGSRMSGREEEIADLVERFDQLSLGRAGCVLIEGDPGIGKSRLVDEAAALAAARGLTLLRGSGDSIEHRTPYYAWRAVLSQLLELDPADSSAASAQRALEELANDEELLRLFPLLAAILALPFPDDEWTATLSAEMRSAKAVEAVVRLLRALLEARGVPVVLIIEDLQWLDEASWGLLVGISEEIPEVFLMLSTRPLSEGGTASFDTLRAGREIDHLRLEPLGHKAILWLVRDRLGVLELPSSVEEFLTSRAEGNPFFSLELAYALRETGVIEISGGKATLAPSFNGWDRLPFPDTLHGVVASRVDRLPGEAQSLLKIASVIGRHFRKGTLLGIHAEQLNEADGADGSLRIIERVELIVREMDAVYEAYAFKHVVIQQVTYGLLLYHQRQELHRLVAGWYEKHFAENLEPHCALLGYHWREAGRMDRAVTYFVRAGYGAVRTYSNLEALAHFDEALRLDDALAVPSLDRQRRGEIALGMGEAFLLNSVHEEAIHNLELGLALLGNAVPRNPAALLARIVRELLRQWRSRRSGVSELSATNAAGTATRDLVCRALISLIGVYGSTNQLLKAIYATLSGVNLAEAAGLSNELARSYSHFSVILDFLGFKHSAARYIALCERVLGETTRGAERILTMLAIGFFHSGRGDFDAAHRSFVTLAELSTEVGDHRHYRDSLNFNAFTWTFQGRFEEAMRSAQELEAVSEKYQDQGMLCVSLSLQLLCSCILGEGGESELHDRLASKITGKAAELYRYQGTSALGLSYLSRGKIDDALECADRVLRFFASKRTILFGEYYLATLPAEIYLTAWRRTPSARHFRAKARGAVASLRRYARSYPIGLPAYYLAKGQLASLEGRYARAAAIWRAGLAEAERLTMAYDEGRTLHELACTQGVGERERTEFTVRANRRFAEIRTSNRERESRGSRSGPSTESKEQAPWRNINSKHS